MRIIETKVYQYAELSDRAKERARDWWREVSAGDSDMLECTIDDAATCGALIGIDLRTRRVKLMGGGTRLDPRIYWSGFNSQGDGAYFEGKWSAGDTHADKLRKYAPKDKELHRIADALATIAKDYPNASAVTTHRGYYFHSGCMAVDYDSGRDHYDDAPTAQRDDDDDDDEFPGDNLTQLMRDFADWIYSQLEKEYTFQNSDEHVIESIEANKYEFTAEGRRV